MQKLPVQGISSSRYFLCPRFRIAGPPRIKIEQPPLPFILSNSTYASTKQIASRSIYCSILRRPGASYFLVVRHGERRKIILHLHGKKIVACLSFSFPYPILANIFRDNFSRFHYTFVRLSFFPRAFSISLGGFSGRRAASSQRLLPYAFLQFHFQAVTRIFLFHSPRATGIPRV